MRPSTPASRRASRFPRLVGTCNPRSLRRFSEAPHARVALWSAERRKVPPHPTHLPIGAMQELIDRALDAAERSGATYADIRIVERDGESLTVKNGALESAEAQR